MRDDAFADSVKRQEIERERDTEIEIERERENIPVQYVRGFAGNNRSRTSIKPLRHSTGSFFASIMVESTGYIPPVFFIFSLLFPSLSANKAQLRAMVSVSPSSNEDDHIQEKIGEDWF